MVAFTKSVQVRKKIKAVLRPNKHAQMKRAQGLVTKTIMLVVNAMTWELRSTMTKISSALFPAHMHITSKHVSRTWGKQTHICIYEDFLIINIERENKLSGKSFF